MSVALSKLVNDNRCVYDHGMDMKQFCEDVNEHVHNVLGRPPEHLQHLRTVSGHTSSNVYMATYEGGGICVVKETVYEDDEWHCPGSVMSELHALCTLVPLRHPNIIKCLGANIGINSAVITFEWLPMQTSSLFMKRRDVNFIAKVAHTLINVVTCIHAAGVVHRDIKCSNLGFRSDGTLVLFDFDSSAGTVQPCVTVPVCTIPTRPPEILEMELSMVSEKMKEKNEQGEEEEDDEIGEEQENEDPVIDTTTYDAHALDWWSCGCVIASLFLDGHYLFPAHSATTPSVMLTNINEFLDRRGVQYSRLRRRVPSGLFALLVDVLLNKNPHLRNPHSLWTIPLPLSHETTRKK
jgi:serine/threonine protein kinase